MAKLTAAERNHMPSSEFAIPSKREFPLNDRSHAANAKSRAQEEYNAGRISKAMRDQVFAAANKVLNG